MAPLRQFNWQVPDFGGHFSLFLYKKNISLLGIRYIYLLYKRTLSLINLYSTLCALRIFILIWTDNVPMTRINIFINFKHYNLIVI